MHAPRGGAKQYRIGPRLLHVIIQIIYEIFVFII